MKGTDTLDRIYELLTVSSSNKLSHCIDLTPCNPFSPHLSRSKQVEVEGAKILVGRTNGELFAVSGVCTHYGAPLVNGVRDSP